MNKVILSLTTIPSRLNNVMNYPYDMKECLNSLLNQTYSEYEVHLNIPKVLKYLNEEYIIPEWLLKLSEVNPKLKLFTDLEDLGPVTKLYYTVQRINNPDTIIVVVDDDLVYDHRLIQEQIKNQEKFVGAVVGYDGIDSVDNFYLDVRKHFCSGVNEDCKVHILQHYKSISYRRSYFEDDFFEFVKQHLSWNDDMMVSAYFSSKKRDRICTYHQDDPVSVSEDEWRNTVGTTFPIIAHTQHDRDEGCNLYRFNSVDSRQPELYTFIDQGYCREHYQNLQVVCYTNDRTLPLAEISMQEFKNYAPDNPLVTIVTNEIPAGYTPSNNTLIFNANVSNKGGGQFSETMRKYLSSIENEYIFLLLDDYITYRKFSRHDINRLLDLMTDYDVDYFSFDKKQAYQTRQFELFKNKYFDERYINVIPPTDKNRLSVQPCIWRRTSLLNLLEKYPDIDIHRLDDSTDIVQEDLLTLGFNWHVFRPDIPGTAGYEHHFGFSWVEIVRHGVFYCPENGFAVPPEHFIAQAVYELIEKYDLVNNKLFEPIFYKLKNKYKN